MALSSHAGALMLLLAVAAAHAATGQPQVSFSSAFVGPKANITLRASSAAAGAVNASGSAATPGPGATLAGLALDALVGKLNGTLAGLQAAMASALRRAGLRPENYEAMTASLRATSVNMLSGMAAVREAYEVSLRGYLGLLLDNTKELRKTLEDGNAVIDTIRTLRGATCEEASFDPPEAKPARVTGPAGSLKISTGKCELKRAATPLKEEFVLDCNEPGLAFEAKVPRYTSRYVSAASATTEECKVTRKYGVESETTVTLFNVQDFLAASAAAAGGTASGGGAAGGASTAARSAGWFGTLFPVAAGIKAAKGRVTFMPADVAAAVQAAIKQATVDLTMTYKPFTLRADLQRSAEAVATALGQQFEVKQQLFKLHTDELSKWANPATRAEAMQQLDFGANLRASLAKLNMSSLFDGVFAKTASQLLAKTRLAGTVGNGQVAAALSTATSQLDAEKPLRSLLAKARAGAGQPVSIKLQGSLEQAAGALRAAREGGGLGGLLAGGAHKGSLLEVLLKDKGSFTQLQQLSQLLSAAQPKPAAGQEAAPAAAAERAAPASEAVAPPASPVPAASAPEAPGAGVVAAPQAQPAGGSAAGAEGAPAEDEAAEGGEDEANADTEQAASAAASPAGGN